jgi:DUF4097 and DUF4098 domain-containing protein YvlB
MSSALGPVRLRTSSKDVDMHEISGDVKLENRNGEIERSPDAKAALGNIDVTMPGIYRYVCVAVAGGTR